LNSRVVPMTVLAARVAYGAALIAAPERLARRWLGPAAATGANEVPLRALGARELLLHAGALVAAAQGGSLRPWFAASIAGDLTDIAATAVARNELPDGAPRMTVLVGGGSALISALCFAHGGGPPKRPDSRGA
jgi:hypothetical protein